MKKRLMMLVPSLFGLLFAHAETIDGATAWKVAREFIGQKVEKQPSLRRALALRRDMKPAFVQKSATTGQAQLYVFNTEDGFVMVSGDTRAKAIAGYSLNGTWRNDSLPANLKGWLEGYAREMEYLAQNPEKSVRAEATTAQPKIDPLLKNIAFDQTDPYNFYCPRIYDRYRSYVGCTATATLQVMKYHAWPERGQGSVKYTTHTYRVPVEVNFEGLDYNWNTVLSKYTSNNYTNEQAEMVSRLSQHVSAACYMDYDWVGGEGSAAHVHCAGNALFNNFSYDTDIHYLHRSFFTAEQWEAMIIHELQANRPIVYEGYTNGNSGHTFVCDGTDGQGKYHINWGWSGDGNGFFELSLLKYQNSDFSNHQAMLIGIRPNNVESARLESIVCLRGRSISTRPEAITYGIDYLPTALKEYKGEFSLALYAADGHLVKRFSEISVSTEDRYRPNGMFNDQASLAVTASDVQDVPNGNYQLIPEHRPAGQTAWAKLITEADMKPEIVAVTNGQFTTPTAIEEAPSVEKSDYTFEVVGERTLRLPNLIPYTLQVHTLGGQLVLRTTTPVSGDVELPAFPAGTYVVSWGTHRQKMVLP